MIEINKILILLRYFNSYVILSSMKDYKLFFILLIVNSLFLAAAESAKKVNSLCDVYAKQIYQLEKNFDVKDEEFSSLDHFFSFYEDKLKSIEQKTLADKSLNEKEKVYLVTYARQVLTQVLIIRQTLLGYDPTSLVNLMKKIDRTVATYLGRNKKLTALDSETMRLFAANKLSLLRYDYSRAYDHSRSNKKEEATTAIKKALAIYPAGGFANHALGLIKNGKYIK